MQRCSTHEGSLMFGDFIGFWVYFSECAAVQPGVINMALPILSYSMRTGVIRRRCVHLVPLRRIERIWFQVDHHAGINCAQPDARVGSNKSVMVVPWPFLG